MQSFPSLKKKVEEEILKPKGHNSASSLDLRKIATTTQTKVDVKEETREGSLGDRLRRRYSADNMRAQTSDSDNHDEHDQEQEQEQEGLFTMDEDDTGTGNVSCPSLFTFHYPSLFSLLPVSCLLVSACADIRGREELCPPTRRHD
jgi:hypothetical protein